MASRSRLRSRIGGVDGSGRGEPLPLPSTPPIPHEGGGVETLYAILAYGIYNIYPYTSPACTITSRPGWRRHGPGGEFVKSRTKVALEEGTSSTYRPQYEIAAEKIVEFISNAELKPGDRLPTEQKLGEQLGMSRGIVREAIKSLAAGGLVTVRKGAGLYVAGDPRLPTRPIAHASMTVDPEHIQAFF